MNTFTRALALSTIVITPVAVGQADKNDCTQPSAPGLMQQLLQLNTSQATDGQQNDCATQDALENQYVSEGLTDSAYRLELKNMDSSERPTPYTAGNTGLLGRSNTKSAEIIKNRVNSGSIRTLKGFTTVQK